ncbi:MAG: FAD-dependent oxidoreductase [Bdellovibrionota bacterium]
MIEPRQTDVLVLGGGMAGIAAAVTAARAGASVALLERYGFLGGMASSALVGTICGAYYRSQKAAKLGVTGFPRELLEKIQDRSDTAPQCYDEGLWFLPYDPAALRVTCDEALAQNGIQLALHSTAFKAEARAEAVESLSCLIWDRPVAFRAKAFVDCSGEAIASTLLGLETISDGPSQAAAYVCEISGVEYTDEKLFQRLLLREAIRAGEAGSLPKEAVRVSVVPGSLREGRALLKLALRPTSEPNAESITSLEQSSRSLLSALLEYLRRHVPELESLRLRSFASQVGVRTGRRPRGEEVLSREDVLTCRKRADAVAQGMWPIERWGEDRKPLLEYFPESDHYDISAACLRSRTLPNLFFAGRNISADDDAIASARVIGTCMSTGTAAGALAAFHALGRTRDEAVELLATKR